MAWLRVNKARPCPTCGKPDGCVIASDGTACLCSRIESDKLIGEPFAGGWLHRLHFPFSLKSPLSPPSRSRPPVIDFATMALERSRNADLEPLASELGVTVLSLQRLQAGVNGTSWTFPMKNEAGKIIGIRLRSNNGKFCVKGSHTGLFIPLGLKKRQDLFICEGPTDTAAGIDLGLNVIGRPNCLGGAELTERLVDRYDPRQVIIIADRDELKTRPDGTTWRPGEYGAKQLAKRLKHDKIKIVKPPFAKDLRQWYNQGATRQAITVLVEGTRYV